MSAHAVRPGGFRTVFLVAFLTAAVVLAANIVSGQFRFEFDTEAGASCQVQYKSALSEAGWQTLTSVSGDGTRKPVTDPISSGSCFYRV